MTGSMLLDFDGEAYTTDLGQNGLSGYQYAGISSNEGRTAFIRGEIVGVDAADATVGTFEISSDDGDYAAVGSFGGERSD